MRRLFLGGCAAALIAADALAQIPPSFVITRDALASAIPANTDSALLSLTLEDAWRRAQLASAAIQTAAANLTAAEGQLTDARARLWNNPELSGQAIRREVPQAGTSGEPLREWGVGVQQAFEIAGQQGYRREAANKELAALQSALDERRREVRSLVEQRFVRVLWLQERIAAEEEAVKLVESAAATVAKRVKAGEDSRLDGNLAAVEAVRARNQIALLREQLIDARTELASTLQLTPGALPEAVGGIGPKVLPYTLDQLLARAAERPLLRALELREQAAWSRLNLERASAYPDITVGVGVGRWNGPGPGQALVGLNFSVPLPLFRRNATGIGKASTELANAQIGHQLAVRDVPSQVRSLWLKVESLRARLAHLEESAVATLDENQRLSTRAYSEGEIGLLQLLVANRQLLDARRDVLDARAELRFATIALEAAAGLTVMGRVQ